MGWFPFRKVTLGTVVVKYVLESLLDWRQHGVLKRPTLAPALQGVVSDEVFAKSRSYSLDKSRFHAIHSLYGFILELAILSFYLFPRVWEWTGAHLPVWAKESELAHSLAFLTALHVFSLVMELPFSLYSTFVLEARHGFNKQTLRGFFKDMLLETALMVVLAPPLLYAILLIVKIGGPPWRLALTLWLFLLGVSMVMMLLYPLVIAPLFNKFTPLPDGELRTEIEKLAASQKFPLTKLLVVDGSTRSAHSNAYLYGFFKSKRIVLFDTLLSQCKDANNEVVAVIAHELGHWKLWHTLFGFFVSQCLMLVHLVVYALMVGNSEMYRSFGFSSEPIIIGLMLFQQVLAPIEPLLTWGSNSMSRRFEFQADEFASSLGFAPSLRSGLIRMQEENKGTMAVDPLYSAYHYSHPPLVERLTAIQKQQSKGSQKAEEKKEQ
eukprot:TRINITY_DN22126_c0_g1_i1.p1 TRINITY_DN22126_c0_g1~~TRINITY_DN22126_c0_g1_i1.p1  ORF type:complete len:477 (+),score=81.72 TRINITY_DN22126_c0_g1_i1:124-1431(+)